MGYEESYSTWFVKLLSEYNRGTVFYEASQCLEARGR